MTDYFVDATSGLDVNDGLSTGAPWQTLSKVAGITPNAGDTIRLKRGEVWRETFYVPSGGATDNRVVYDAYGTGALPRITGCDLLTGWAIVTTPVPPLFADSFESGDISAWSTSVNPGGALTVGAAGALLGSNGLSVAISGSAHAYVQDNTPASAKTYRCRFYIDPNSLAMANGNEFIIFRALTSGAASCFFVKLQYYTSGGYRLFVYTRNDAFSGTTTTTLITDAQHYIELSWQASSAAGANNGTFQAWIDGVQVQNTSGIDSDTLNVDTVRMGAELELDAGTSGTMYFDAFYSNNTGAAIGATDPVTESDTIYQATFNNGIDTYLLLEDGEHLTRVASLGALSGAGMFFADDAADTIYVWCSDSEDPDTHTMEIGARYDAVNCDDRQHVEFRNLRMHGAGGQYGRGFGVKPTWNTPAGIALTECEIDHNYYTGIWAAYASTFSGIAGLALDACHIHHNLTYGGRIEAEDSSHRMTGVAVNGCEVNHNGSAALGQEPFVIRHVSAPLVEENEFHHNNGALDWSDGLLFGDCPELVVRRNRAHDNERSGIHLDVGSYGTVELNLCYENGWNGLWVEEHVSGEGCTTTIYNNTCYHNLHGLVFGPGSTIREVSGVTVKNNIFALNRRANVELNEDGVSPDYLDNVLDYNLYQTDPTDPLYENEFRAQPSRVNMTFAAWKTYTSWDANSINADPLLTDPEALDFTLQPASPAINAGTDVGLTLDYLGITIPQGSLPDIGAFELAFAGIARIINGGLVGKGLVN